MYWMPIMKDESWVIIDTETDGLCEPIHIVEIAAQKMKNWEPNGEPFQVFLDHGLPISPEVTAIHGYTEKFLSKHGIKPRQAHALFAEYAGTLPLVAHNIAFDWNRALVPEWQRLKIPQIGERGFCTMSLSRRVIDETPNYKLQTLKDYFGLNTGTSHRGANDVTTVVNLCRQIIRARLDPLRLETFADLVAFSKETPVAKCLSLVQAQAPTEKPNIKPKDEWYFLDTRRTTHGPHTAAQIFALAQGQSCYVWREGLDAWVVSAKCEEFTKLITKKTQKKQPENLPVDLMQKLKRLCQSILADGIVSPAEVVYLSQWLESVGQTDIWPLSELSQLIEQVLEDSIVSPEEQVMMKKLLMTITNASDNKESKTNQSVASTSIRFACSNCDQKLETDLEMAHTEIDCPTCGQRLMIPTP